MVALATENELWATEGLADATESDPTLVGRPPRRPINATELKDCLNSRLLKPGPAVPKLWTSSRVTHWEGDPIISLLQHQSISELLHCQPGQMSTSLEFVTAGLEGKVVGYRELSKPSGPSMTAKTSSSLSREPASYTEDFVRGKSGYFPFTPGGLEVGVELQPVNNQVESDELVETIEKGFESNRGGIRTIPPGFTRGLDFGDTAVDSETEAEDSADVAPVQVEPIYVPTEKFKRTVQQEDREKAETKSFATQIDEEVEALLPNSRTGLASTVKVSVERKRPVISKRDWAHVVDVNQELVNFRELVPYPFELDTFQKEAVYHLEMGDSVFIAAHTSAGKTVVAEYAIALAARHMTRCIYTSPIKALSNQKFRDFKQTFDPDTVGILTGDVQVNPDGSCLIMTTEILRSMLYKGADLIRDVEFVVFDEVHYINDSERGVVWEEVIIMLPDHVTIILLSATVPNTKEFADWVGRTKKKDIYVISTPKRPVPLEHFLYANKDLYKILNAKGEFLGQGHKDAGDALKRAQVKEREAAGLAPLARMGAAASSRGQRGGSQARGSRSNASARGNTNLLARGSGRGGGGQNSGRGNQENRNLWVHLVGLLKKQDLLPVVAFTFSKRRCEDNASSMPNTDLCTAKEKSEIHVIIERSLKRLNDSDKKLPQILRMRDMLSRGVGVHHGGLLPIVKELVEILFTRGLVKVLFATETFAMGVNMPARSVVFSGIKKHDGHSFRDLLPGEYTQMSGRAGRRGLDSTGVVIIVCTDQPPDTSTLHKMLLGQPTKLQSQFRLTYNMILNLLRVEALRVEEMIKRSFSENAQQRLLPDQQKQIVECERELRALSTSKNPETNDNIEEYLELMTRLEAVNASMIESILKHPSGSRAFQAGRLVILRDGHFRDNPAVILKLAPAFHKSADGRIDHSRTYLVLAFVPTEIRAGTRDLPSESVPPRWPPRLQPQSEDLTYELAVIPTSSVSMITKHLIKLDAESIANHHRKSEMENVLKSFKETQHLYQLANTNIIQDIQELEWESTKLRSVDFRDLLHERDTLLASLTAFGNIEETDGFTGSYEALYNEQVLKARLATLRMTLSDQNLELLPDYEARIAVLKELKFIDERSTVLLKGRVACEINSSSELILTELILDNVFMDYDPSETVALLSALVFQDKTDNKPILTPALEQGCQQLTKISERVEEVCLRHRVEVEDVEGPRSSRSGLNFGMVELVWNWAQGMPFAELVGLSDIQEGTIVRTMTRLDESCREVKDAARIIGDATLGKKMEACQALIRRDVIFVSSLYI
ncbi:NUC185 domain-containing protein [Melampsora americana]|nr:NUC185 domain-containing protein [Melampsora americana]